MERTSSANWQEHLWQELALGEQELILILKWLVVGEIELLMRDMMVAMRNSVKQFAVAGGGMIGGGNALRAKLCNWLRI